MSLTKAPNEASYFPGLTGIRAIAAFMVYLHHFNPFAGTTDHKRLLYFFTEFNVGVTLFFVLSGFLIAYRYYHLPKLDFKQYIVNRIARIYPMYFLLTVATFICLLAAQSAPITENLKLFALNITFLRGYFESIKFSGVSQGWSLTVEETFYFLAPLLFILIRRTKLNAVLLPLLLLALGFLLVRIFQGNSPYGFMNSNQFMLRYTFLGRSAEFFTGIGLALVYKKYKPVYTTRYFTYIGIFFSLLFIIALSILGKGYSGAGHPIGMFINSVLLPVFGFAPLFWGLMSERNFICSALSSKFFVLLGKSSYIFYLIHIGIISAFLSKFTQNSIILFVLINLISIALFKTIEEPLNHFIRNKYRLSQAKKEVLMADKLD